MGEIADALRRARSQRPAVPAEPGLRGVPGPVPRTAGDAAKPALAIESVEPRNTAIVLEAGPAAEACRHLALRLRNAMDERRARSVAIVSSERGDGKTTVACNLAIALATLSRDREVALLDLDLRRPAILKSLALPHHSGVEEVLSGKKSLDAVRISVHEPAIDVFPAVTAQGAAHELIVLPQMAALIADLERDYATVIVDTPPAPLVPDATLIMRHVATCVPIVRSGKTRGRSLRKLMDALPHERLLGWILNCERSTRFGYRDYYYGEEPETSSRWAIGGFGR